MEETVSTVYETGLVCFSLGEQHQLGFTRVLVNAPCLAILDEDSSTLDLETERVMYSLLEKQE